MLRNVLILSYDQVIASQLEIGLSEAGVEKTEIVSSTRDLFTIFSSRAFDLTIIPANDAEHRIRALQAIRQDVSIVLMLEADKTPIPKELETAILGVLHPSHLQNELALILMRAGLQKESNHYPVLENDLIQDRIAESETTLISKSPAVTLASVCSEVGLDRAICQIIISDDRRYLLYDNEKRENRGLAHSVAEKVQESWDNSSPSAQVQYIRHDGANQPLLLYTRSITNLPPLLTLVARPQTELSTLRQKANLLVAKLADQPLWDDSAVYFAKEHSTAVPTASVDSTLVVNQDALVQSPEIGVIAVELPSGRDKDARATRSEPGRLSQNWAVAANLAWFLVKRLAFALLVLLAIIVLTYFGLNMARGLSSSEAALDAIGDTVTYIEQLLQGDLGTTTAGSDSLLSIPVSQVIAERLPRSLALLGLALLLATGIGLPLGISAARRGSRHSLGVIIVTIIGVSVPSFFAAFLLQWAVTTVTRQAGRTILPVGGFGWDAHLILPVVVLAARPLAQITRITFTSVGDVIHQDFVRTALSKGLRNLQVLGSHILRNSAIPILTTIGISLRFALSSLPVVELYFGWPGIGATLIGSIARQDDNLTVSLLLCLGIIFLLVNILIELSYRFIDPRTREAPAHLTSHRRHSPLQSVRDWGLDIKDYLTDNAVTQWIQRKREEPRTVQRSSTASQFDGDSLEQAAYVNGGGRASFKTVWRNFPLVVGGVLVLILLVVVLFGPQLAPRSPYATQGLELIDGQLVAPPFGPSEGFPWGTDVLGRDLMSLIITGAQLTLTLTLLVVVTRMVLGILLGVVAGWTNGGSLDRFIVGLAEILSAIPTLLLAMVLILALGIRQGLWPFIVGLGFIGWGETMQYVRSQVITVRPKSFIESAVAIGARTPRILLRHVLPIITSSLISIFALEMGAVLMLLGELGFLSIFIGGGAFYELETFAAPYHYSDVPEWGALLSNIRTYSRAYPWLTLFPTLAFFIAILAFNLFGEGVRRLVDSGSLVINRVINRYTIAAAALFIIGFGWFQSNSGTVAFYQQHAQEYDSQNAYGYVEQLTDEKYESRALGTDGATAAAQDIAAEFANLGLQPAGEKLTFLQERARSFGRLEAIPELSIEDGGPPVEYRKDFAAYPGYFMSQGEISGTVRYVGLGPPLPTAGFGGAFRYPDLRYADYSDEIILALDADGVRSLRNVPHGGVLVVADDPALLNRRITMSSRSLARRNPLSGRVDGEETPAIWITEAVANRLLANSGETVASLRQKQGSLEAGSITELDTGQQAYLRVDSSAEEQWPAFNVIGHLPGTYGTGSLEDKLDHKVIFVLAQYDSPPLGPEDEDYPAANDNASGVGVMLEAIRVLQETDYTPKKTFLFVAYSGEGWEGGESVSHPDINKFLQAKTGFATSLEPEAIVHVRGVGGGSGDRLEVSSGGSLRLAELFETAARRMDADIVRSDEPIDISIIYEEGSFFESGQDAPEVRLTWLGWEDNARLPTDTLENISADNLGDAGRTLALALMIMGGERDY